MNIQDLTIRNAREIKRGVKLRFSPFNLEKNGKYYVKDYFRPQNTIADTVVVPENIEVKKGKFFVNGVFELRGKLGPDVKVIADEYKDFTGIAKNQEAKQPPRKDKPFSIFNYRNFLTKDNHQNVQFSPFCIEKKGEYVFNNYFRPKSVIADYLIVPEDVELQKGNYLATKLFELKGRIEKSAMVLTEKFDSYKDSNFAGMLHAKLAEFAGNSSKKSDINVQSLSIGPSSKFAGKALVLEGTHIYGEVEEPAVIVTKDIYRHKGANIKGEIEGVEKDYTWGKGITSIITREKEKMKMRKAEARKYKQVNEIRRECSLRFA